MPITRVILKVDARKGPSECHITDLRFQHTEEQIAFGIALRDRAFLPPAEPISGYEASFDTLRNLRLNPEAATVNSQRVSLRVVNDVAELLDVIEFVEHDMDLSCRVLTTFPSSGSSENPR
ncbi:hypothetical protein [Microvirga sp. Mcv34]|uniref:hypothetical protein n=1 Tax=Microvirga sp. Mcv34 TaxID=2926016 RepID=UPI0021C6FD69|nr:hypothetical protein [Microvirga sp. Mcv34]